MNDKAAKSKVLPDLMASFKRMAEEEGLDPEEAQQVAQQLQGPLFEHARKKARGSTEVANKHGAKDRLLPEEQDRRLPGPLYKVLRRMEAEEEPFLKVHRLIDAIEWAVKWHTTLVLSDLLRERDIPLKIKLLLARGLRTPSLGLWNQFFRETLEALDTPSVPWRDWEHLLKLEDKHHLVNFRNKYAHGATPSRERCQEDVEIYLPVFRRLIHSPVFTDTGLVIAGADDSAVLLRGPSRTPLPGVHLQIGHAAALLPHHPDDPS